MKVRDIMKTEVRTCRARNSLLDAGHAMRDSNCGSLPVIDENGRVVGMITDRDICLKVTKNDEPPSRTRVETVMSRNVQTCRPDDDVADILDILDEFKIRRLPVVDETGVVDGILSIDDILCEVAAGPGAPQQGRLTVARVLKAFRGIHERQQLVMP